jgi:hypothetical protein
MKLVDSDVPYGRKPRDRRGEDVDMQLPRGFLSHVSISSDRTTFLLRGERTTQKLRSRIGLTSNLTRPWVSVSATVNSLMLLVI